MMGGSMSDPVAEEPGTNPTCTSRSPATSPAGEGLLTAFEWSRVARWDDHELWVGSL